ncbi:hypothetical protein [Amycolatopsis australiensis]|uniref:hypothetical protein n=1 Tax=Amycolatopsis australiensis TaxID=546364 RepID=UPI001FE4E670|nr:hypothetical protein [Amycolatopsis australiensis]
MARARRGLDRVDVTGSDADLIVQLLLGFVHSDLVLRVLKTGETDRLTTGLQSMISTLLR